jgi:hypothetical protein
MEFLKSTDLALNPAGYLVGKKSGKPVNHEVFVRQQKAAEYVVKLSEAIKDKNFKCGKVDDLEQIKAEVMAAINAKNTKSYVADPKKPVSKANEELVKYALDFVEYEKTKSDIEKINQLMAQFDVVDAIETVGDYFSEGLCKLNAIYTIDQILEAVKINAEKLK